MRSCMPLFYVASGFSRIVRLELEPESRIDRAPFKRRPRVHGPAAGSVSRGTDQPLAVRLPHVGQVLGVDEHPNPRRHLEIQQSPPHEIWSATNAIRVVVEGLRTGVEQSDPRPRRPRFPQDIERSRMSGVQRNLTTAAPPELGCPQKQVAEDP